MRERIQAGYGYAPGPTEDLHLDRVDLTQALSRLRPEEREAIYLQAVKGYTAAEAAELMDRPRGTVLSLIHRGKAPEVEHEFFSFQYSMIVSISGAPPIHRVKAPVN